MSDSENSSTEFVWTAAYEVQLMFAMIGLKPVGINQHFNMVRIMEKFSAAINQTVEADVIWKHLNTWYDMEKLDEVEPLPFPNDDVDFELPEEEFGEMIEHVKKNGSRLDRIDESLKKGLDDLKKEAVKEESVKDSFKDEDNGLNKGKSKSDVKKPLFRRTSKSDKTDSSGTEETKDKDEDKEKSLPGGRTRRSNKVEDAGKDDSNDGSKKVDSSSVKKPVNKKETLTDSTKKKPVSETPEPAKQDNVAKRILNKTPIKNIKGPEKTPKRVTRASTTPSELDSAKKKRRR